VILNTKYVHTNLIARDWRALSRFYEEVFGCTPVMPERNLSGPDLEAGTGVPGARLQGVHLRLPGYGPDGPTLEIFQYSDLAPAVAPAVNRPGFAHLAFSVPSVPEAREQILLSGGSAVGEVVSIAISPEARVTWCYVTDPEGNILELQSWSRKGAG
jgi:predicted enzyme related to lactoylglutathione lyase